MNEMSVKTPENLQELINCLKDIHEDTWLISGGTDLIIQLRKRNIFSGVIIDLMGIKELDYIREEEKFIKIGSATTLTRISENEIVKKYAPALQRGASRVGSTQIRNRGTIAGNIANSSPCADTVPPLMAMGGLVRVANGKGNIEEKTLDEVIIGSGKNNLKKDEAIIEIVVPKIKKNYNSAFTKLGSRRAVTISKINAAAVIKFNYEREIVEKARVFLGALGAKTFRSQIAEKALINKKPSKQLLTDFSNALTKQVDMAIEGRKSRPYKREAIKGVAHDIYLQLFEDKALGGSQ
ncbi:FAD binding domain-containing protein [Maledivibacter halophilus]|uniref:Carbon-monoxide dehydrogenase medium subunit n=1 Tax=Maledivibacter halophilus TaxID=36842 RepID=A0A1T5M5Q8_9FIRM|nr:FAD binding domain-containing protein [Maledivibacter halophilus]SKC83158.1 carbon-monoxide dehydrogenase medium subunit [Maledivibacter halophilus]